jgi:hypothetical protein
MDDEARPYTALGKVMDELARKRNVRGPHGIANYVRRRFPDAPGGVAVAKWMYGDASPKPASLRTFSDAFELSDGEMMRLAWAFVFRKEPPG